MQINCRNHSSVHCSMGRHLGKGGSSGGGPEDDLLSRGKQIRGNVRVLYSKSSMELSRDRRWASFCEHFSSSLRVTCVSNLSAWKKKHTMNEKRFWEYGVLSIGFNDENSVSLHVYSWRYYTFTLKKLLNSFLKFL